MVYEAMRAYAYAEYGCPRANGVKALRLVNWNADVFAEGSWYWKNFSVSTALIFVS
jgi:hypothetical protein